MDKIHIPENEIAFALLIQTEGKSPAVKYFENLDETIKEARLYLALGYKVILRRGWFIKLFTFPLFFIDQEIPLEDGLTE